MNMRKRKAMTCGGNTILLGAALALPLGAAFAQAPPELEVVVVTAERRAEDIRDVPISVSTVSGENLDVLASGGQDVRLLAARIPSLNVESSFGRAFPRFYIRGYGNTDFRLNASQPVSLIYDEVVQENPILKGFPIFDVDQIEVLRGPQGTLFGRNTPGGVVKFDSVKPSKEFGGYINASEATYNTANIEGAINVPLGANWSARFSAMYQHRDDFVGNALTGEDDVYEGYDDRAGRVQLMYDPGETFSALFNAHMRSLDGTARLFRANIIQSGSNDLVSGFDPDTISIDGRNEQELNIYGGNIRLRWDFGNVALYSITGYETLDTYSRGDIDGGYGCGFCGLPNGPGFIPFPSETADGVPSLDQFTQELRLESQSDGAFNWQAGVYYFDEDYDIESFAYDSLGTGAQTQYLRSNQTNTAYALFGSISYAMTDAFELSAGVRYTNDEKDFVTGVPEGFTFPDPTLPTTASLSDSKVNWDVSGTFAINDAVNLYARVATGFRGASVQPASAFGNQSVAEPENNTSVEVGVKADLMDRRAKLYFNLYRYEVKDQQLTAVGGASNAVRLLNADKTVGQGAELDFQAYLTQNLLVTLGASYNDTEIEDDDIAVGVCFACTVTDPIVGGLAVIDGNQLPQAPEWISNFTLRYGIPLGNGELFAYTDWAYRSEVNFFLYESVEFTGKELLEGGLRIGYNWSDGKYEVAVFGRNITDEEIAVGAIDFNNLTGFINEPRTVGVQLKANF
ncbi:iron complex outermembrane receptor protein [Povalibacter uvarum]|uniref:Iron complex outermembrane receptor protein n=2 Tax=Povalibacter uvarum TaxID=732238 RepID=A0A841HFU6_9GAMM|nr:TonB-dependent receptor [Povalibacter uvarum]MBB6091319.1 iron complex outermembrane receptor protein [Povalibacter uvarum]